MGGRDGAEEESESEEGADVTPFGRSEARFTDDGVRRDRRETNERERDEWKRRAESGGDGGSRGEQRGEEESCVRWSWVRPRGTSCSPSRLPINQTRPNA